MTDTSKSKSPKEILAKIESKLKSSAKTTTTPTVNKQNTTTNNGSSSSADFESRRGTLTTAENPVKNTPIPVGHYKTYSTTTPTLSSSGYTVDNTSPKDSMMDSISFSQSGSPRILAASPKG